MMRVPCKRFVREQAGFTLVEMMVTMMVMIVVLFALYNIFDSSVRVFSFGNNKVEAVENARLGLEKMEREIRASYPINKAGGDAVVLSGWTATSVTFGNDLDSNGKVECVSGSTCERIKYDVYKPSGGDTYALGRTTSSDREPVVEFIDYTDANNTGLSLKYFKKDGVTEISPGGDESQIAVVRVALKVKKSGAGQDATQALDTDVALRNRVGTIAPASGVAAAACSNSVDDDRDDEVDFGPDPGCSSVSDTNETDQPACSDGTDNDSDGKIDVGLDPGCDDASDTDETDSTPAPNQNPTANADDATVAKNSSKTVLVLDNDTDPDGPKSELRVTRVFSDTGDGKSTGNGTLAFTNGDVTYSPKNGFNGEDTFKYTISDGSGGTSTATVTVTVTK